MRQLNGSQKNRENQDEIKRLTADGGRQTATRRPTHSSSLTPHHSNDLHDSEPRWFAIHTRSKCEKLVRKMLEKKGIEAYVPIQKFIRSYLRKIRTVEKPVITCYVFVKITKPDYVPVLETENVAGFVRLGKDLRAISEHEIDLLRRITMEKDLDIETMQGRLTEGDLVEIGIGNLTGMRGRIVERAGKRRFSVELESIGYTLLISLDASVLLKLERV